MWALLNESISSEFNTTNQLTFLLNLDKTNLFVGKNNCGKSFFLRFLLKNIKKIYSSKEELVEDLKTELLNIDVTNIHVIAKLENLKIRQCYEKYNNLIKLLENVLNSKKDTNSRYVSSNKQVYNYTNEKQLLEEIEPLFEFLGIKSQQKYKLDTEIVPKHKDIKNLLLEKLKEDVSILINDLDDMDIVSISVLLNDVAVQQKSEKYYFPILRSIRHPLKDTKNSNDEFSNQDIYKNRVISEYDLDKEIKVITGLNFYRDYKKNLLGTKEKREKTSKFEKFLSDYFFNGEIVSIIPDEETFELKVNINDGKDRFIYQVGDGITSLLIIMYTIFMECDPNTYKIFFIEEPENSFHPGFQRLFINMLTYFQDFKKCIFIITTHSNHLINISNRETKNAKIFLIKKEMETINISEKNDEYYDVIDELGVQASSVLLANKAIWIEGKYDALYIRLLLNLKNINNLDEEKFIEDYDYCFIPYGGKNMELIDFETENNFDRSKEFIAKARKINSNYMVILDDDNMLEENKKAKLDNYKKLSEILKNKAYKLKVREIENLFPEDVVMEYIRQGVKDKKYIKDLAISFEEYKTQKLGEYINSKIQEKNPRCSLKTLTGRENGFLKNGFLYDKNKFYKCVLEWSKTEGFRYEEKITNEAKDLINEIDKFIRKK